MSELYRWTDVSVYHGELGNRLDNEALRNVLIEGGVLVPVDNPLLTREEAAADPEVRALVMASIIVGYLHAGGDHRR